MMRHIVLITLFGAAVGCETANKCSKPCSPCASAAMQCATECAMPTCSEVCTCPEGAVQPSSPQPAPPAYEYPVQQNPPATVVPAAPVQESIKPMAPVIVEPTVPTTPFAPVPAPTIQPNPAVPLPAPPEIDDSATTPEVEAAPGIDTPASEPEPAPVPAEETEAFDEPFEEPVKKAPISEPMPAAPQEEPMPEPFEPTDDDVEPIPFDSEPDLDLDLSPIPPSDDASVNEVGFIRISSF